MHYSCTRREARQVIAKRKLSSLFLLSRPEYSINAAPPPRCYFLLLFPGLSLFLAGAYLFTLLKGENRLNISFPKGNGTTSLCNLIVTFRFLHLVVLLENTQHQVLLEEFSEYRKQIKLALLTRSQICQGTYDIIIEFAVCE